ncbi:GTPase-activating protein gyp10 [Rhodotorula toruloides]|uniref:GTPase-activating protein gyp10 n=1 Tax=Rhodotorula toruloides TaxID=5286 RepID=A0A511KAX7_RHOTO|nr:GTPase-activating protein gyp10 [Rhodotorula toruloides]
MQLAEEANEASVIHTDAPADPLVASTSSLASPQADQSPALSRREQVLVAVERGDRAGLEQFAAEGPGFEDRELRRKVWPVLLGCSRKGKQRAEATDRAEELASLPVRDDERQVRLDIDRSLVSYPKDVADDQRDTLRQRLETAILTVLRRHPALQYFQGYHDIISILLLVLDDDQLLLETAERLSLHQIRDSMGTGLEPTLGYLKLVHRVIGRVDPYLHRVVNHAASMPFFALSWALTLLSHDIESVAVLARFFDFLLAHNPAMICYLVVSILLTKKEDLVAIAASSENDPAMIHSALSQLPNIVLQHLSHSPPPSPSPAPKQPAIDGPDDYLSEDLVSSASFVGSDSDLLRSPTLTATTAEIETEDEAQTSLLDASVASTSEALPSRTRDSSGISRSTSSSFVFDADDESGSLRYSMDESLFSDPDIDGPAFDPLPPSRTRTPSPPARALRTPSPQTSRSGNVFTSASPGDDFDFASHLPPPRIVLAADLIARALELSQQYPLEQMNTPPVLGPNSCVSTWKRSMSGELGDEAAEDIVRSGEGIVDVSLLGPDASPEDETSDGGEIGGEDDFELVEQDKSPRKGGKTCRRRSTLSSGAAGLNLGPHGWLVVSGVAVATAAVAYGVYQQGGLPGFSPSSSGSGKSGTAGGGGLGTAGVGLGLAGGLGGIGIFGGNGAANGAAVAGEGKRLV